MNKNYLRNFTGQCKFNQVGGESAVGGGFLFDKEEHQDGDDRQAQGKVEWGIDADLVPEQTGDQGGRQGAQADDHLVAAQDTGPKAGGREFRDQRLLCRFQRPLVQAIEDKSGDKRRFTP